VARQVDLHAGNRVRTALSALENAEAVPTAARAGAIEQAPVGAGAAEVLADLREG